MGLGVQTYRPINTKPGVIKKSRAGANKQTKSKVNPEKKGTNIIDMPEKAARAVKDTVEDTARTVANKTRKVVNVVGNGVRYVSDTKVGKGIASGAKEVSGAVDDGMKYVRESKVGKGMSYIINMQKRMMRSVFNGTRRLLGR